MQSCVHYPFRSPFAKFPPVQRPGSPDRPEKKDWIKTAEHAQIQGHQQYVPSGEETNGHETSEHHLFAQREEKCSWILISSGSDAAFPFIIVFLEFINKASSSVRRSDQTSYNSIRSIGSELPWTLPWFSISVLVFLPTTRMAHFASPSS